MRRVVAGLCLLTATAAGYGLGAYAGATDSPPVKPVNTVTADATSWPLTTEQIDVLTEGDDWDHPWESCTINSDYWVTCPDGALVEYPAPLDDGSITDPRAFGDATDLEPCDAGDEPTNLPCQVPAVRTTAVGGDGNVHDGCIVVLLTQEDSELVCPDSTVWPS